MRKKQNAGSLREKVAEIKKACKDLQKSETTAAQNQYIIGDNLRQIKDEKLFLEGFEKFEDFCEKKFGFSKQYAYMLIKASVVQKKLEDAGLLQLKCPEKILRLLTAKKYQDDEILKSIWSTATQEKTDYIPTSKDVMLAKKKVLPPVEKDKNSSRNMLRAITLLLADKRINDETRKLLEQLKVQLSRKNNNKR